MPKSDHGNRPLRGANRLHVKRLPHGFTLIELLVVITLIAIASAVATLALRDPAATRLEREGARLAALLEAARVESRSSGLAVKWVLGGGEDSDFRFVGLPPSDDWPRHWLGPDVSAEIFGARFIALGPEPMIGAQRIQLRLDNQRLTLSTDGLSPFEAAGNDGVPVR